MERHWLHVFATFDPGGPQLRTARLLELLPTDYRHTIVAMDGRTGCAARVAPGVRLQLVPPPAGRGTLRTVRGIARLLRAPPDLLLTYNWGAIESLLAAWRAGFTAVVHHEEGFGTDEIDRLLPRRNLARRALLRRARAVVVPSRTLETIAREVWRQPSARVHYLPNGVDLARFAPRPRPTRGSDGAVVIGSVATFRPVKNQALLLRAFARVPGRAGARLELHGDGPDRTACETMARELGIAPQVTFAGTCDDTARAYAEMDVFALSSRSEQMPIVVLEAMASGLPVVATDVGDVAAMVAPENRGLVVVRDDADALAAALGRAIVDPGLRARIGAANRARCAATFAERACLDRYVQLYESVAGT